MERGPRIHLSTLIVLILIAALLLLGNVRVIQVAHPSAEDFKVPQNLLGLFVWAVVELLALLIPYFLLEARIRRKQAGQVLILKRSSWIALSLGTILIAGTNVFFRGLPFGYLNYDTSLNFFAVAMDLFVACAVLTVVVAMIEAAK